MFGSYSVTYRAFINVSGGSKLEIFFFPCDPHPTHPDKPPGCLTLESLISVHFGSVSVPFAAFGSVWVSFGSISGPFRGFGGGRGGVGERGFCKGKEYH